MSPPRKFGVAVFSLLACLASAAAGPASPGLVRIAFKDLPGKDPVREVVRAVLHSRLHSLRDMFTPGEWSDEGYGAAWERARAYFPDKTFLVRPGTYFMTHGFDANGRLFMEIHESPYLGLCVENWRTFAPASIVGEYARMRTAAEGREAAAFRDKVGGLEPGFVDDAAWRALRKALGEPLSRRLLDALREEDYHMLAGGLMHEGTHAALDDALASGLQAGFKAGGRGIQWDELRAFMAEAGYHIRFSRRAAGDVETSWTRTGSLLRELESFRRTSRLPSGSARDKLDRVRSQARAYAVLVRLRSRETWQSARRVQDLADGFRRDYVKGGAPPDLEALLAGLENDASRFVAATGEAIQSTELALRSLERTLGTWDAWAAGRRPFPPPLTDSRDVVRRAAAVRWPAMDPGPAASLMRRAAQALAKERVPS